MLDFSAFILKINKGEVITLKSLKYSKSGVSNPITQGAKIGRGENTERHQHINAHPIFNKTIRFTMSRVDSRF